MNNINQNKQTYATGNTITKYKFRIHIDKECLKPTETIPIVSAKNQNNDKNKIKILLINIIIYGGNVLF